MGMNVQASQKRGRRHGRRHQPVAEINVTPFVDVMLVLLIIFMVSAPLMTVGVPVDLASSKAKPLETPADPLMITIQSDGKLFLQEAAVTEVSLLVKLQAIKASGSQNKVFVRGDTNALHGNIMKIMGLISAAGFEKISYVTNQEQ